MKIQRERKLGIYNVIIYRYKKSEANVTIAILEMMKKTQGKEN